MWTSARVRRGRVARWAIVVVAAMVAAGCVQPPAPPQPPSNTDSVTVDDKVLTVSVPVGQTVAVTKVSPEDRAQLPPAPDGFTAPFGSVQIVVTGVEPGEVATATVTLSEPVDSVRKLIGGVWDPFDDDGSTGAQLSADGLTVTLQLQDGGRGDSDGVADGTIVDPFEPLESSDPGTPCAPGTFNSVDGNEPCEAAPPGTFVANEGAAQATPCELGTFQDQAGQTSCVPAPPGTFVANEGAAQATPCELGTFQDQAGQTSCQVAPIGTYVDSPGATAATPCADGRSTLAAGATAASDCVTLPPPPALIELTFGTLNELNKKIPDANVGAAVAVGDLNCDGFPDLIASAPGAAQTDPGFPQTQGGEVQVEFGVPTVLFPITRSSIGQTPGSFIIRHPVGGAVGPESRFGEQIAVGDFNGDDCDDLVVSDPYYGNEQGALWVFTGPIDDPGGVTVLNQGGGFGGTAEAGDRFGWSLAVGDFDGDGYDDLAVGTAFEHIGSGSNEVADSGLVQVKFGGPGGMSNQSLGPKYRGLSPGDGFVGPRLLGDNFGWSLAAGDVDGDGFDDLVIGAPGRGSPGPTSTEPPFVPCCFRDGAVFVKHGTSGGLPSDTTGDTFLQAVVGFPGEPQSFREFGSGLTIGDFDGDGFGDLVVGAPGSNQLFVKNGSSAGLSGGAASSRVLEQGTAFAGSAPEPFDGFGSVLSAGDVDRDGFDDLVVGIPGADRPNPGPGGPTAFVDNGLVHLKRGSAAGLAVHSAGTFDFQPGEGLFEQPFFDSTLFGSAVAIGDLNSSLSTWDIGRELVIGVPGRSFESPYIELAGEVAVIDGTITGPTGTVRIIRRPG